MYWAPCSGKALKQIVSVMIYVGFGRRGARLEATALASQGKGRSGRPGRPGRPGRSGRPGRQGRSQMPPLLDWEWYQTGKNLGKDIPRILTYLLLTLDCVEFT